MPRISAFFTNSGVPLTSPATAPTIRIRRQDTQALVVTDDSMTEQGDGVFTYDYAESPTLEYVFRCDGDPIAAGQTTAAERYVAGGFSGVTEARIETDIPAILVDTDVTIPALIAALNNLNAANVTAAVWGLTEAQLLAAGPAGLIAAVTMSQNTDIDFTGDDVLGWQLVVNDILGSEIARFDIFDEAKARIPGATSVSDFIANQKAISRIIPS